MPSTEDITNTANALKFPHTPTSLGKIRRQHIPSAIRLQPYVQDTAVVPSIELPARPSQRAYILNAPQTPAPAPEKIAALPQLSRQAAVTRNMQISAWEERVSHAAEQARVLYIPPMTQYRREPGDGEMLLGCCALFVIAIIVYGLLYYLIH